MLFRSGRQQLREIKSSRDPEFDRNGLITNRQIAIQQRWCQENGVGHIVLTEIDLLVKLENWRRILRYLCQGGGVGENLKSAVLEFVTSKIDADLRERSFRLRCVLLCKAGRPADGHHDFEHRDAYRRTHSDDDLCNLSGMKIRIWPSHDAMLSAFTAAFVLLCIFHGLLIAAAVRLSLSVWGVQVKTMAGANASFFK